MDTDLKSTIKPFISKAHPSVKEFIASDDLENVVEEITRSYNLSENEISNLNDLIVSILIGLTDPIELFDQVAKITSLPVSLSEDLSVAIQNIIISTFASKINPSENEVGNTTEKPSNNIGQSFEKIILNQAKAMQPAREEGWVPENLPAEKSEEKPQVSTPNYTGQDPYRETLE